MAVVERRSNMGPAPIDRSEKACSICNEVKALDQFGPDRHRADGRKRQCRSCLAIYSRHWSATNRASVRATKFRAKYGLSVEEYQALRDEQEGLCAICSIELGDHLSDEADLRRTVAIDHDHQTGAVRGLLCPACNCAIGYMADTPERLEAAATYLRERT